MWCWPGKQGAKLNTSSQKFSIDDLPGTLNQGSLPVYDALRPCWAIEYHACYLNCQISLSLHCEQLPLLIRDVTMSSQIGLLRKRKSRSVTTHGSPLCLHLHGEAVANNKHVSRYLNYKARLVAIIAFEQYSLRLPPPSTSLHSTEALLYDEGFGCQRALRKHASCSKSH
jgi:hypothetical protein